MSYNAEGQRQVTAVDGSTHTGAYAADGSLNVVINDGSALTGVYHACGGYNAVVVTDNTLPPQNANGSLHIIGGSEGYALLGGSSESNLPVDGLTHHWPFNDRSGLVDVVGGIVGTNSGSTAAGYKRTFDADWITLASSPIPDYSAPHSVMLWGTADDVDANGSGTNAQTWVMFSNDSSNGVRISLDPISADTFPASQISFTLRVANVNIGVQMYGTNAVGDFIGEPMKQGSDLIQFGYTYDGTTIRTYLNGIEQLNFSKTVLGITDTNRFGTRNDTQGQLVGGLGRVAVYNKMLTDDEVLQFWRAGPASPTSSKLKTRLVAVGGSNLDPNSYFEQALVTLPLGIGWDNRAESGEPYSMFDTNFVTKVQPYFNEGSSANILVLQSSNGDTFGQTAAEEEAFGAALAAKWHALGASARVIITTPWNYGDEGDTARIARHSTIRDLMLARDDGSYDAVLDVWNIEGINTGVAAYNATYVSDGIHLTTAGHALVAPYLVEAINEVLAQ